MKCPVDLPPPTQAQLQRGVFCPIDDTLRLEDGRVYMACQRTSSVARLGREQGWPMTDVPGQNVVALDIAAGPIGLLDAHGVEVWWKPLGERPDIERMGL